MENLEKLFSRLNWEHTGLAAAKELRERNDGRGALQEVIRHFRERTTPAYLFDEKDIRRFDDKDVITEAERVCRHEILGFNLGPEIDWHRNQTEDTIRDPEWAWSLFRHGFWVPLARSYAMTGDEKYAREWMAQLKGWFRAWPVEPHMETKDPGGPLAFPGEAWRTIETGIRLYTVWLPLLVYFRKSPSWDEEGWVCFLNSIHDHAEFLRTHYSNHIRSNNWLTMECSALFQAGVLFPELRESAKWMRLGYRRMSHEVRYQFDHSGVHIERTPIYHLTAAGAFLQAYRIAVLNAIPAPPYMLPILERSAEYLMRLVKPDFSTPMFGDADRNSLLDRRSDESPFEGMNLTTDPLDLNELRAFFRVMAELTSREDFRWLATGRRHGNPPAEKSSCMPDAGFYVMRTGWQPEDSCLMLTGINIERGALSAHWHDDAAHLELQVEGEDVLIDTGRYVYGNAVIKEWREHFHSAAAHNTVQVDDHLMGRVPDWPARFRGVRTFCHRFESAKHYDAVEVSHNGYAFMDEPVFHLRRVIFVKPSVWLVDDVLTGVGEHEYRLYFNFAPGRLEPVADKAGVFRFTGRRVGVRIMPLWDGDFRAEAVSGREKPIAGWVSYGYAVRVPAPHLVYSRRGPAPVRFVTALIQEEKDARVSRLKQTDTRLEIGVETPRRRCRVCLDDESFQIVEGEDG